MSREVHVRFWERAGVRFPRATHLPLYRQSEIYAREGVELDRSTLADWVGGTSRLFEPLVEALRRHVMSAQKLHADDTPVPVLAPWSGKDKNRTTVDVCTRRSASGRPDTTRGVVRLFTGSQGGTSPSALEPIHGERCRRMVTRGSIRSTKQGRIQEAACWAHVRRKFYDLQVAHKSPVAAEALERIGALYAIEKEIQGRSPEERREIRDATQPAVARIAETMAGRNLG